MPFIVIRDAIGDKFVISEIAGEKHEKRFRKRREAVYTSARRYLRPRHSTGFRITVVARSFCSTVASDSNLHRLAYVAPSVANWKSFIADMPST